MISRKQTIGYMLFDGSTGLNIDGHKDLFTNSILKISFDYQSVNSVIGVREADPEADTEAADEAP